MQCPRCKQPNPLNARYCSQCGCPLFAAAENPPPDAQMTVILPAGDVPHPAADSRQAADQQTVLYSQNPHGRATTAPAEPTVLMETEQAHATRHATAHKHGSARPDSDEMPPPLDDHALPSQATHFSIVIATASVAVLFLTAIFFLWERHSSPAQPEVFISPPLALPRPASPEVSPVVAAASSPAPTNVAQSEAVAESAPVAEASLPSNAAAGLVQVLTPRPTASAPEAAASAAASAPVAPAPPSEASPVSAAPSAPAAAASAPAKPVARLLKDSEIIPLVADMKRHKHPSDCANAVKIMVSDYNMLARQAVKVAKLVYPDLCAPAAPASAASAQSESTATPKQSSAVASPQETPEARTRTVDEVYETRSNAECSKGAFGHVCRELLRLKLCSGKLSDDPQPGQTVCSR